MKIGRPRYKFAKIRDPITRQRGYLFQLHFPQITKGAKPQFRFMSTYEQNIEDVDERFQYLIVAAEPYNNIAFKIQNREIDQREGKLWTHWNRKSSCSYWN